MVVSHIIPAFLLIAAFGVLLHAAYFRIEGKKKV
jgi:hypothetical protein